jgi:hypothetical protein
MPNRLPHYVIWRCDPAELGATKLNKICWYSDLDAHRTLGHTITGATDCIRQQCGPTPKGVHKVIDKLSHQGRIAVSMEILWSAQDHVSLAGEAGHCGIFVRRNRDRRGHREIMSNIDIHDSGLAARLDRDLQRHPGSVR